MAEESMGARIRRLRKDEDWTQEELAEKVGRGRGAVGAWEGDDAVPKGDALALLASTFGVSVDYLLHGPDGLYRHAFQEMEELISRYRRRLISGGEAVEDADRMEDEIHHLERRLAELRERLNDT